MIKCLKRSMNNGKAYSILLTEEHFTMIADIINNIETANPGLIISLIGCFTIKPRSRCRIDSDLYGRKKIIFLSSWNL